MKAGSELRAVAFDLDDTILRDDLTISDYTVYVLRRLHSDGYCIIAASGRARLSMKPYVDQIGCVNAYISCNGAEIWDGPSGSLIRQELFSAETAREIACFAEVHDCYAQTYEDDRFCFNRYGEYADRYALSARLKGVYVGKLSDYIQEPRNKILLMDDEARIAVLYKEAAIRFSGRASVTCSKPFYLEFNPVRATKGIALDALAEHLGILPGQIVAFGDSLNDLSMLRTAGISVTVSNGWQEIRPYCDHICGSNNEDGPAHFLDDLIYAGRCSHDFRQGL